MVVTYGVDSIVNSKDLSKAKVEWSLNVLRLGQGKAGVWVGSWWELMKSF